MAQNPALRPAPSAGKKSAQARNRKSSRNPAAKPQKASKSSKLNDRGVPIEQSTKLEAELAALDGNEQAIVAFIERCGSASMRFKAAQLIRSAAALEQVRKTIRDTDRRVAKLMQHRLDDLTLESVTQEKAQVLLQEAHSLCDSKVLRPNQVVALERRWVELGASMRLTAQIQSSFDQVHQRLTQRLQAQAVLQREMLDTITALRLCLNDAENEKSLLPQAQHLVELCNRIEQHSELASLPTSLLPELRQLRDEIVRRQTRESSEEAAIAARETMLTSLATQLTPSAIALAANDQPTMVDASKLTVDTLQPIPDIYPIPVQETAAGLIASPALELLVQRAASHLNDEQDRSENKKAVMQTNGQANLLETRESLQHAWRALPMVTDAARATQLQERFTLLLDQLAPAQMPTLATKPKESSARRKKASKVGIGLDAAHDTGVVVNTGANNIDQQRAQFFQYLEALQLTLDDGALQAAMEQDRLLRMLDLDQLRLKPGELALFNAARAELARLQGWARWGGVVSREELLASVEELPKQSLSNTELAKKVGSMRARWRALDATAGVAPRALWMRFDTACTAAYAPAAAHFAKLSQERAATTEQAELLLQEIAQFWQAATPTMHTATDPQADPSISHLTPVPVASAADPGSSPDLRALAIFTQRVHQAWQRLGPLERKEKKRFETAFAAAMAPLDTLLTAKREQELAQRSHLIAEVTALSPLAKDTPERLQALQARWQQQAKAFPLPRDSEQESWQRFRSACDTVYNERKNATQAADGQRNASLQTKQMLCAALETIAQRMPLEGELSSVVGDIRTRWNAAGEVPRAAQASVQTRFDNALDAIEKKCLESHHLARQQIVDAVIKRLSLCEEIEAKIGSATDTATSVLLQRQWEQLAPFAVLPLSTSLVQSKASLKSIGAKLEATLQQRFDAAITALNAGDQRYAGQLQFNQPVRDGILIAQEVALGLDSPSALMKERLALQVAGLQSTFKGENAGKESISSSAELINLCAMPALADAQTRHRMGNIVTGLVTRL